MEIKIIEQRSNPLLQRTEYRFEIDHATAATPTRDAVRNELAKALKAPKERVVIERLHAKFGIARSIGEAMVYDSTDAAKATARTHILVRNGLVEKAVKMPAGAAPAAAEPARVEPSAAPKAEAPKEA
ncbi:MAG: 30S ribosomal protein S24e [Thermoplasmata archaeon]